MPPRTKRSVTPRRRNPKSRGEENKGKKKNKKLTHFCAHSFDSKKKWFCRCLSAEQARGAFDWEVYITIAFAFGISTAMEKTKVCEKIQSFFFFFFAFVTHTDALSLNQQPPNLQPSHNHKTKNKTTIGRPRHRRALCRPLPRHRRADRRPHLLLPRHRAPLRAAHQQRRRGADVPDRVVARGAAGGAAAADVGGSDARGQRGVDPTVLVPVQPHG